MDLFCVWVYRHMLGTVCMWKSVDNQRELIFSFYFVGPGFELRLPGLVAGAMKLSC